MIQNLIFLILFFEKIIIRPNFPVDIIRVFFIPEFLEESLKANKD